MRLASRLAITLAIPALLLVIADHVLLPGIPSEVAEHLLGHGRATGLFTIHRGSIANMSVFALGITPVLTAFWIVEVVALLVPRWAHLRHGNPAGRASLDRASTVLALVLSVVQGLGVALSLGGLGRADVSGEGFSLSIPVVMATLVGGVCIQVLAARLVSKQGLVNGYVMLVLAPLVSGLGLDVLGSLGIVGSLDDSVSLQSEPRAVGLRLLGIAAAALATWAALRAAGDIPRGDAGADAATVRDEPYRQARRLVVHPWIPIPCGSLQPYTAAGALITLPYFVGSLIGLPPHSLHRVEADASPGSVLVLLLLVCGLTVLFARLMHRPADMTDLAGRLGAGDAVALRVSATKALREAWLPSFLFFVVIIVSSGFSGGSLRVVIVTAILMDLAHAVRTQRKEAALVPIWEERRVSAVPVLRAALASSGIASETRGMHVQSLWQVFAPYAPAEILVRRADESRATAMLRHLLVGEPLEGGASASTPVSVPLEPWSRPTRDLVLAGALGLAGVGWVVGQLPRPADTTPGPRATLEVFRVDDTVDPFEHIDEASLPEGSGISIYAENVPVGPGKTVKDHFARMAFRTGEAKTEGVARFNAWLATIALPRGARFGVEDVSDYDENAARSTVVGVRTFVLTGDSGLGPGSVTDAHVGMDSAADGDPQPYVAVTLSEAAAKQFEELTRAWTNRRLAIVIDGEINSAPIIKSVIAGGHVSITLGRGDPDRALVQAKDLAARLRP